MYCTVLYLTHTTHYTILTYTVLYCNIYYHNVTYSPHYYIIGKYYAVEDMLTTKSEEKFGQVTLRQHYERIAVEGQDYDPYTTMLAGNKKTPTK